MNRNDIQKSDNIPLKKGRMANLELLRCAAMMMVVVLHYLGKGNLLADLTGEHLGSAGWAAWLLESFCIVAVNVYMFISGYFLCVSSFKVSRLVQLWLQVWVYSVGLGIFGAVTGILQGTAFDTHYMLTLLFPVSMGHYWFMTAYFFLYFLIPFVGQAVRRMTRQQFRLALGLLLSAFCILKSIFPVRFEMDSLGYDCLWYLCVFLTAAYVRRFGCCFLERKRWGAVLYIGGCLLVFAGTFVLRAVYLRTGSLGQMLNLCLEYNHILPFLASIGLFAAFYRMKIGGKAAKLITRIAPYTLGVYLLHENLGFRYSWQDWLGAGKVSEAMTGGGGSAIAVLLFWTVAAALCVFTCGILVDVVRKWLFGMLHKGLLSFGLYRRLTGKIAQADDIFRDGKPGIE